MLLRNLIRQTTKRHVNGASKIAKNAPNVRHFSYIHWPFFSEEHVMIQESTRAFAEAELKPIAFDVCERILNVHTLFHSCCFVLNICTAGLYYTMLRIG